MESNPKVYKNINLFLKLHKNFKEVETFDEANALLIFFKHNLSQYIVVIKNNVNKELISSDVIYRTVFLKNTNPHDSRNTTLGSINKIVSRKRRY